MQRQYPVQDDGESGLSFMKLAPEVIEHILAYLPLGDVIRSSLVSYLLQLLLLFASFRFMFLDLNVFTF